MGGTWRRLTFSPTNHPVSGAQAIFINRFTNVSHGAITDQLEKLKVEEQSVPNTHGGAPFVVKIQLNSHAAVGPSFLALKDKGEMVDSSVDGRDMLIYDRQRTLRVIAFSGTGEPGSFNDVADVVKEKGYQGLKVFCWAIRSGDWTVDVCIDHLPEWENW